MKRSKTIIAIGILAAAPAVAADTVLIDASFTSSTIATSSNISLVNAANGYGDEWIKWGEVTSLSEFMGEWNHWVFTQNVPTDEMNIYLQGSLWHKGTGRFRTMSNSTTASLGSQMFGYRYDGAADDFRLYGHALNTHEVATSFETYRMSGISVGWLSTDGLSITDSVALDNPDGDALVNFAEYALGGMPIEATDIGYPVSIETLPDGEPNGFEVGYQRRAGSETALSCFLEISTTLLPGSWPMGMYVEVSSDSNLDGKFECQTNQIDISMDDVVKLKCGDKNSDKLRNNKSEIV